MAVHTFVSMWLSVCTIRPVSRGWPQPNNDDVPIPFVFVACCFNIYTNTLLYKHARVRCAHSRVALPSMHLWLRIYVQWICSHLRLPPITSASSFRWFYFASSIKSKILANLISQCRFWRRKMWLFFFFLFSGSTTTMGIFCRIKQRPNDHILFTSLPFCSVLQERGKWHDEKKNLIHSLRWVPFRTLRRAVPGAVISLFHQNVGFVSVVVIAIVARAYTASCFPRSLDCVTSRRRSIGVAHLTTFFFHTVGNVLFYLCSMRQAVCAEGGERFRRLTKYISVAYPIAAQRVSFLAFIRRFLLSWHRRQNIIKSWKRISFKTLENEHITLMTLPFVRCHIHSFGIRNPKWSSIWFTCHRHVSWMTTSGSSWLKQIRRGTTKIGIIYARMNTADANKPLILYSWLNIRVGDWNWTFEFE